MLPRVQALSIRARIVPGGRGNIPSRSEVLPSRSARPLRAARGFSPAQRILPEIAALPLHGCEVAITAVARDGDDTAAPLLPVRALGDLDRREDVGPRGVTDVQALLRGDPIGYVPAVFGGDWQNLGGQVRVVDGRHDRAGHVLQALEAVQRFGRLRRDAVNSPRVLVQA